MYFDSNRDSNQDGNNQNIMYAMSLKNNIFGFLVCLWTTECYKNSNSVIRISSGPPKILTFYAFEVGIFLFSCIFSNFFATLIFFDSNRDSNRHFYGS